ncbi:MAG: hypothetical protein JGK17_17065 [Microcoleus sp. PH2017_10_PVI_O_A]|uniref:hypothetical protein n=1 Tax=unclassified Microcoleus TaxID=2642155 RepID=UPI001D7EDE6A|nr:MULTISPECIES: hypothetical protein [unclassified Microcoleus]TAE81101.1 MAG: hypothetical protein EAZ83_16215 [Oscillatoriales cyanobacterium]MCC3407271.1 hypothetical protein [Microcoleus sp. PH2017_10_PVI_O_A]MCC3461347.1 hypothetical protein [Microcoleus sp. PH2017_11_PCY_U_A]MCC3479802.1 hypothetical protein [Microcoleus sp. PH2017_12_PCY_D_A]MCC3530528.1 hypothetical protein [Microcoleus sp. PH2017_21_RUC_O_A]
MDAVSVRFLFEHFGRIHSVNNRQCQNHHAVFFIEAIGTPEPNDGISQIRFYQPSDNVNMGRWAGQIIEKYLALKLTA